MTTSNDFPNLLKPITFGRSLISSNRMYFSSVGFDLCDSAGRPLPEFFSVYESIMNGGCGFGFLGNASVDPSSQYTERSQKLVSPLHADDLRPIFKVAQKKSFPLSVQLQHYGTGEVNSLSEEKIEQFIQHFDDAARLALEIGAPALQIHAANGYLLSSFLSPKTNHRNDHWGGTATRRANILLEIIKRVRATVQDKMAIFVRLQVDDGFGKEGLFVELLEDVVMAIEEAGADAITCATGVAETFAKFLGDAQYTISTSCHAANFLKQRTKLPVGFSANIDSLLTAEKILADGDADFIGFGRPIIADHQFVNKELSGRPAEVNRCRWDSYCLRDKKEPLADRVFCCVNPQYLRPQHIQTKYEEN